MSQKGDSLSTAEVRQLRLDVMSHLGNLGFQIENDRIIPDQMASKASLRSLQESSVLHKRAAARNALAKVEDLCIAKLQEGSGLRIGNIRPYVREITDKNGMDAKLFRWASLHWSVPISAGYGRRLRFLILDGGHNDALVGILGLADPVYSLSDRDRFLGWTPDEKRAGLVNMLDAYVLGAVPPYRQILGGKLVALLTNSVEVQEAFAKKYANQTSHIGKRSLSPTLMAITTASALGRSSIYNRVRRDDGQLALEPVGFTAGTGDFQFEGDIYERLKSAARSTDEGETSRSENWPGTGYRNKRETVRRGLQAINLSSDRLRVHGIRRQIFVAPLCSNVELSVRGMAHPDWSTQTSDRLAAWWLQRWASGRFASQPEAVVNFKPDTWRLWAK